MEKLLVIYGGKSVEHDISIITALQAMRMIGGEYELQPVYITRAGEFVTGDNLQDVNIYADFDKLVKNRKQVLFEFGSKKVIFKKGHKEKIFEPDCALVCNHGQNGEDGLVSALMTLCDIPYTCPSMQTSALCMDKAATKAVLKDLGFPVTDYAFADEGIDSAVKKLGFPIIVKPSRCGSSIGIEKCTNVHELTQAIKIAKIYDKKVILEHFIQNGREFNCACITWNGKAYSSKVCEVLSKGLYDFDEKYLSEKSSSTYNIERPLAALIKKTTENICLKLECEGVVRVDYLMDEEGNLFVNEINTVPGSLSFYLFSGMKEVVAELVEGAKQRHELQHKCSYEHPSNALNIFASANMNKYSKK